MKALEPWIPLIQQLIWPIFIGVVVFLYRDQVGQMLKSVTKDGRSLQIGSWFQIGEGLRDTEIKTIGSGDFSMDAIEGDHVMIEKGGSAELQALQRKIANGEIKKISNMLVRTGKRYSLSMLTEYVSKLGIEYVIFKNDQGFDGWINASAFTGQLLSMESYSMYNYQQLRSQVKGISTLSVTDTTSASAVLEIMKKENIDHIAVVKDGKFGYMVSKQDILTSVISNVLLTIDEKNK